MGYAVFTTYPITLFISQLSKQGILNVPKFFGKINVIIMRIFPTKYLFPHRLKLRCTKSTGFLYIRDSIYLSSAIKNSLQHRHSCNKTANPEIAAFKTLFEEVQKTAQSLKQKLAKIKADSPDVADKLSAALKAFGQSLQN